MQFSTCISYMIWYASLFFIQVYDNLLLIVYYVSINPASCQPYMYRFHIKAKKYMSISFMIVWLNSLKFIWYNLITYFLVPVSKNDFPCLGADIADILGHKDTKVISDDNLAALVRQIAVNCDVGGFFLNFFCLSSQKTLFYLKFAIMLHKYLQFVTILWHYLISN